MPSERLETLMRRHFDGDLTPEEIRELDTALSSDPAAARRLMELADEHLALSAALGRPVPRFDPARAAWRLAFAPRRIAVAAAAAAVLALIVWQAVTPGARSAPSYRGESLYVLAADGELALASSLAVDVCYLAREGAVAAGGAELSVKAPTVFTLRPCARGERQGIVLAAGHVVVTTRGGAGVEIETGRGTLRDIGTQFEVRVDQPMEEKEMVRKIRAGTLPSVVAATVLTGLVQWNSQAGEEKVLSPSMGAVNLAFDASAGTILEREGLGMVKALGGERWTLACARMRVERGDWLKTGARGANALEFELKDGTRLILGPAGLLEVVESGGFALHAGELAIAPAAGAVCTVKGPGGVSREVNAAAFLGIRQGALAALETEPRWHALYKGKASTEAMGELLATIDGRSVPLTLGYHKVAVDIRDQIARTVVEESFVNHTDATLEGQFYFPLPQEASISGFAMWIGNELVEADIVEKERAREIYEEIVREKRDPALLEWTGGNVFKARVFPIPAHGEKRIRITYTQVLPKQGRTYRYAYALRSELLRKNPLRELQIKVTLDSAEELANVACTSHLVRAQKTAHAASVEFTAQEYTPDRDFEVLVTTVGAKAPLLVIPHLRGKDGYFMALLQAGDEGGGGRGLVRDTAPLDFLLIADTSASMSDDQLKTQRAFIACVLESLAAKDTFNIVAFDTAAAWAFSTRVAATAENREAALAFLERRGGLGWTDLDLAFKEALARAGAGTQVIYVGDGIPTAGDTDPAAFAARLKLLFKGEGALHAIGIGSTYEAMVLKAIASLGRGSFHQAGSVADATEVAARLLAEITSPGLKDVSVAWQGFRTARVYPEELPNLPAGAQQIILGRYLPEGKDLTGKAVLTAVAGGVKTTRELPVSCKGAEQGNAFIPRLWARMHLDHLLAQGPSEEVKDAIIALSEDYQIITPYTSLLVLESDADRERFKVTKRLRMRDGEEFFAESRERAEFALAREHMLKAALWRKGIRRAVLDLYASLGYGLIAPPARSAGRGQDRLRRLALTEEVTGEAGLAGAGGYSYGYDDGVFAGGSLSDFGALSETKALSLDVSAKAEAWFGLEEHDKKAAPDMPMELGLEQQVTGDWDGDEGTLSSTTAQPVDMLKAKRYLEDSPEAEPELYGFAMSSRIVSGPMKPATDLYASLGSRAGLLERRSRRDDSAPFASLFPSVHGVRPPFTPKWPAEIRELVAKLDRRAALATRDGGLGFEVERDGFDVRGTVTPFERGTALIGKQSWVTRTQSHPGDTVMLRWTVAERSGVCDASRMLAAERKAGPGDAVAYAEPFDRYFEDLERQFPNCRPELVKEGGKAVLTLTRARGRGGVTRVTIDLERPVILEVAFFQKDVKVSSQTFGDFVDAGGLLWPQKIEWRGKDGKVTSVSRIKCTAYANDAFAAALAQACAPCARAITLQLPFADLVAAKTRTLEKKATLTDLWQLVLHAAATQQWDTVNERFGVLAQLCDGKPGLDWVRIEVMKASRRNEEAKQEIMRLAAALESASRDAGGAASGCYGLARALFDGQQGILQPLEQLTLLDALKPVFERQDERLFPVREWTRRRINCLDRLGRPEDALALRKESAARYPYDLGLQTEYASMLSQRGETAKAVEYLRACAGTTPGLTDDEVLVLENHIANLYYDTRRLTEYLAHVEARVIGKAKPVGDDVVDRYLAALVLLDRTQEADALIGKWLEGARGEEPDPTDAARLAAALRHALGQGRDLWANQIDAKWVPALGGVARAFARSETRSWLAGQVLDHWRFKQLDAYGPLADELYTVMTAGVAELPPAVLANLCRWTSSYTPKDGEETRDGFYRAVYARWEKETDTEARGQLENIVVSFGGAELTLALRRAQLAQAVDAEAKAAAARQLFDAITARPWNAELERELAGLIGRIGFGEFATVAKAQAVQAYARYVVNARTRALQEAIPDRSKLSRRALAPLMAEAAKTARTEAVAKLVALEAAGLGAELAPFITIERASIEAKLGLEPSRVSGQVAAIFEALPELDREAPLGVPTRILAERCLIVLGYLATVPEAESVLAERSLGLLDAAIAKNFERADVRMAKYRLLVALDRGDALEEALRAWAQEAGAIGGNKWRIPYGYILAERGKLEEAVKVFQDVKAIDELGAAEYRVLAGWCMALNRPAERKEALVKAYMATNEWQLQRTLAAELNRYRRNGDRTPDELGEDVFLRFAALFRKATEPSRHLHVLRQYYETTKDFRLLETLSEAVLGQTAVKVYDALVELYALASLIGDEATIDKLEGYLRERRGDAKTEVDRRALFLIEFMVEARAAAQAQGGEPHGVRALAALKEAFKEEWIDGEEPMMARFLASGGQFVEPLRAEVLAQLAALHAAAAQGSQARFEIGTHRGYALWNNDVRQESVDVFSAALEEYRTASGGLLPAHAHGHVTNLSGYLVELGHFVAAEKMWRAELGRAYNDQERHGFRNGMYVFYRQVIERKGTTALGAGEALYRAVRDEILAIVKGDAGEYQTRDLVQRLCEIYGQAKDAGIERAAGDLRDFAFKELPGVLARHQYREGQSMVSNVSAQMHGILGARAAVEFLIVRAETEPAWLARRSEDFWSNHHWRLAVWRTEAGELGSLEPRLLALVLAELTRTLERREYRSMEMYHRHYGHFWEAKAGDFFATAMAFIERHRDSEAAVKFAAEYLYAGLDRYDAAIDALTAAYKKGILGREGRAQLVTYLQAHGRWAESLVLLEGSEGLVARWPDDVRYRAFLILGYHGTGQNDKAAAAREAADAYFRQGNRWTEDAAVQLADACVGAELYAHAVDYFKEAITFRKKASPPRRGGDGQLSGYYERQAVAYARLGRTADAVDAAAGAIVVWTKDISQRNRVLEHMKALLAGASDLPQYAAAFDRECETTKLEKPVIRNALGRVFMERKDYAAAALHLEACLQSGPFDVDVLRMLIQAYDAQGAAAKGTARLLTLARRSGHNYELYKELAERMRREGDQDSAERAVTTLAEMSANESEGRALLAQVRESEKRFLEAAAQWRHVVRVRSKEAVGYLGVARNLLAAGQGEEARKVLEEFLGKDWAPRFGDVKGQARELLGRFNK